MTYQKYIDLGFKRIDITDNVRFKECGYYGFILTKKLNNNASIEVTDCDLKTPKLYIKKSFTENCHIVNLTQEMVVDLLTKEKR